MDSFLSQTETDFFDEQQDRQEEVEQHTPPYPDCIKNPNGKTEYTWIRPIGNPKGSTSAVWEQFSRCIALDADGSVHQGQKKSAVYVVKCHLCSRVLSYSSSSTKGMGIHLKTSHIDQLSAAVCNSLGVVEREGLKRRNVSEAITDKRQRLEVPIGPDLQKAYEEDVMKLVVVRAEPFSIVEDAFFRKMVKRLNPNAQPIGRHRLSKLIADAFGELQILRANYLKNIDFFGITIDEWSEPSTSKSLLAIRAHGWTKKFERFSLTLDIADFLEVSHTADSVVDAIKHAVANNGLDLANVLFIVSDAGSVMVSAAKKLDIKWIHCLAHKINLVVEDILKQDGAVNGFMKKAQRNSNFLHNSTKYGEKLKVFQESAGLPNHRPVQYVPTRWNSWLAVLNFAVENNPAISALADWIKNCEPCDQGKVQPGGTEDIESATLLIHLLSQFQEATSIASTDGECVSTYVAAVISLKETLEEMKRDQNSTPYLTHLVDTGISIVKKRFYDKSKMVLEQDSKCAMFLDPRFSQNFDMLSEEEWGVAKMEVECKAASTTVAQRIECENSCESVTSQGVNETGRSVPFFRKMFSKKKGRLTTSSGDYNSVHIQFELLRYMQEVHSFHGESLEDLASFWKENSREMPMLYELARRYLSPPISSVDVERLFSVATYYVGQKQRNRLENFKLAELLMLREYFVQGERYFSSNDLNDVEL